MTLEYRHAQQEDMLSIMRAQSLGFGATTADAELQKWLERTLIEPKWRLCAFDAGEPVAQFVIVPTTMHWHGREISSAGVTDVFTIPTYRRRGVLRELMTRAYAQMHDAGQAVAILEASFAAIYQRFGWGVVYTGLTHDFDPRHLRFVDEIATPGRVRLVRREDARPIVEPAYTRFAASRTLTFARRDHEWQRAFRLTSTEAPLLVAVYEEQGETLGYVIYGVSTRSDARPSDPGQRLTVYEWVWLTPVAHRALVNYLAGHDLVDSVRMHGIPLDDPLFYATEEPRGLNTTAMDGALTRIVDLQTALTERRYHGTGRLVLGIEDTYAPWNSGVWQLEADENSGTMRRVTAEPHLRLTPRVLALLATGYQPASALARAGLIACADPAALSVADEIFRTSHVPFCLDHWM
jgi:predicted acetyltransferase